MFSYLFYFEKKTEINIILKFEMQGKRELLDLFDGMDDHDAFTHDRKRGGDRFFDREPGGRGHPVWLDKSGSPNFRIIVENSGNLDKPLGSPDSRVVTPLGGHDRGRTGKYLSEALIFSSTNPHYGDRVFIDIKVRYKKIPSSNLGTFRPIFVHNMFSPCSTLRTASDKDLPVMETVLLTAKLEVAVALPGGTSTVHQSAQITV